MQPMATNPYGHWKEHALGWAEGRTKPACLTEGSLFARDTNAYDNKIADPRGGPKHQNLRSQKANQERDRGPACLSGQGWGGQNVEVNHREHLCGFI